MSQFKVRITGTRPLLMHADLLSNPLNALTKEHKKLTGKKKKTEEDSEQIAKSEWAISMYYDSKIGPYLNGTMIEASLNAGAKLRKLGMAIKRGVEVLEERCPLEYEGPRKIEKLWDKGYYDVRGVKIGQKRIMRYRPIFKKWATQFTIVFDEEIISKGELLDCLSDAGAYSGIGDYRPKFGRYDVEEIK